MIVNKNINKRKVSNKIKDNNEKLDKRRVKIKQNKIRDSINKDLNSAKNFKMLIDKIFTVADHTHKGKKIHKIGYKNKKILS